MTPTEFLLRNKEKVLESFTGSPLETWRKLDDEIRIHEVMTENTFRTILKPFIETCRFYENQLNKLNTATELDKTTIQIMKTDEIIRKEPFISLFSSKIVTINAIESSIKKHGYDKSFPVVVWKGKNICIDGHQRLYVLDMLKKKEVPVSFVDFKNEDEAVEYAIRVQRAKRNLNDDEIDENTVTELNTVKQESEQVKHELNTLRELNTKLNNELETVKQQLNTLQGLNSELNKQLELNNRLNTNEGLNIVKQDTVKQSLNILGYSVQESGGYYRAFKKVGGKMMAVYLGKNLDDAENKIRAKEQSLTAD